MMNNSESIKQMVEQLYSDREQTGDVTFVVEARKVRAHRNVLAASSPKYKAQFYGPNPDEGEIRIPNVSAAAFKEFIQFFYKESIDLTMENIESVLDLAKQSLVDGSVEICIDFLKKSITASNVCFVYRLANLYSIISLCRICERQISFKTKDVFASDDFLRCDRNLLLHILKLDMLDCAEIDVFNVCIAWARADCKQRGLDEKKPENLRAALGDAIYQVRFSSVNTQEFAAALHNSLDGFFSAGELVELISITAKVKDFTSQKFNQTLRVRPKYHLEGVDGSQEWSLECDRFEYMKKYRMIVTTNFDSEIHCDKPIRMYGLALGFHLNPYKSSGCIWTRVARNNGQLDKNININCKYYHGNNETIVIFDEPIERITAFRISFTLSALKVNYELVLKDQVVIDNNKFTCSGELVKRFFFDNL